MKTEKGTDFIHLYNPAVFSLMQQIAKENSDYVRGYASVSRMVEKVAIIADF